MAVIRNLSRDRSAIARFVCTGVLLAALIIASPVHVHSSVDAETACVVCSLSHHAPSLHPAELVLKQDVGLETAVTVLDDEEAVAGFESEGRTRSPPSPC